MVQKNGDTVVKQLAINMKFTFEKLLLLGELEPPTFWIIAKRTNPSTTGASATMLWQLLHLPR